MKETHEVKDNITLYKEGVALSSVKEGEHTTDYEILKDELEGDTRTVILKKTDPTERDRKSKEMALVIATKLGEPKSRTLKSLLLDVFKEYWNETVDRLYERIVIRGEAVKAREGCFKILVGDGRRKDSEEIMIRE